MGRSCSPATIFVTGPRTFDPGDCVVAVEATAQTAPDPPGEPVASPHTRVQLGAPGVRVIFACMMPGA